MGEDDTIAEDIAQQIHDKANANLLALAPYGITAIFLGQLQTAITAYHDKLTSPQLAINTKKLQRKTFVSPCQSWRCPSDADSY